MIQIIFGKKGSGKTKKILDLANQAVQEAKGNVLFVDEGKDYTLSLKPQVRFIDAGDYSVKGAERLYGFLAGILAGNYDISYLFIDGLLRLVGEDSPALEDFFARLDKLAKDAGTTLVMTYSEDAQLVPESIRQFQI